MKILGLARGDKPASEEVAAPLGGTRAEAMQRLQVGLAGIGAMLLLVALANVIQNRARVSDEQAVPEAAPTTEPSAEQTVNDPLADAGIVPDMPAEPEQQPDRQTASQFSPGQDGPDTTTGEGGGVVEDIPAAEGN